MKTEPILLPPYKADFTSSTNFNRIACSVVYRQIIKRQTFHESDRAFDHIDALV